MSKYISFRNRSDTFSFQLEKRAIAVFFALACLFLLVFVVGLSIGSTFIHPVDVIKHLLGFGTGEYTFVIQTLRLPRMVLSILVGAALGVAGLILQGIVRNPLGSPDIIGITGGASFAAVFFITYFADTVSIIWLPFVAILGAGIVSLVIFALAWKNGISPFRLILIGIGMSSILGAMTTMMIVFGNTYTTSQAYVWMTGSVYGANWENVTAMLPWVLILIPLTLFFSKSANAQALGDLVALGLGVRLQLHRFSLLLISVALAGSAVAYAGGIGFVGLMAPHIARMLVGQSFGNLVPIAAMTGGLIVMLADVVARTAFLPLDLPAGVFVSGIGAPFFIYLLYRNRNA
ncbi:iron chelate uptake ABC transporter family permease subunit [Sporosarcina sp. Marseille-Q4943]|uniref:FecCD family ABC transporter permease n=1 Tax=Sporosarcina sp. Marseille-Q4943 TaxID=2942204 RepID=UPI00208DDB47|nr:iron ABC transporter permease [Sporosarcina sp. Marseille-Q4943]